MLWKDKERRDSLMRGSGRPGCWDLNRLSSCTMMLVGVVDVPKPQSGYAEMFIPGDGHSGGLRDRNGVIGKRSEF